MLKECKYKNHLGERKISVCNFVKDSSKKDGLCSYCNTCRKKQAKLYYKNNREQVIQSTIKSVKNNPEKTKARNKRYHQKPSAKVKRRAVQKKSYDKRGPHPSRVRAITIWYANNKSRVRTLRARKRANIRNATPRWVNFGDLEKIYTEANRLTTETGIVHEVHHRIPLIKDQTACGLHSPNNLIILTKQEHKWYHSKVSRLHLLWN